MLEGFKIDPISIIEYLSFHAFCPLIFFLKIFELKQMQIIIFFS